LARVDPLVMNLLVAKSIPSLANLDIDHYQTLADQWADGIRARLPRAELAFKKTPDVWKNDVRFVRLAVLCEYVDRELGIAYREDQRDLTAVWYTDPSDLFLNGVMDTRRGTCGNMSMLHVALGWRLGWPLSLACVRNHKICRYDDGEVTYNIEATQTGLGGFKAPPDSYYIKEYDLSPKAISSGSDLRAVKPRELLGIFMGARGRHMRDTDRKAMAVADYLTARSLFPTSRDLYINGMGVSIVESVNLFEEGEKGHPSQLAAWLAYEYASNRVPIPMRSFKNTGIPFRLDGLEHYNTPPVVVQATRVK
jgi:hypothetical protein